MAVALGAADARSSAWHRQLSSAPTNFRTIANQIPSAMLIATGMTFVLIIAEIDLSVGSVLGLCGAVLGVALTQWHWPLLGGAGGRAGGGAALRRLQRPGLDALAAAVLHRHAGHAGDGARRRALRDHVADAIHRIAQSRDSPRPPSSGCRCRSCWRW